MKVAREEQEKEGSARRERRARREEGKCRSPKAGQGFWAPRRPPRAAREEPEGARARGESESGKRRGRERRKREAREKSEARGGQVPLA